MRTVGLMLAAFAVTASIAALTALWSPPENKPDDGLVHCVCTCDGDQAELQIETERANDGKTRD